MKFYNSAIGYAIAKVMIKQPLSLMVDGALAPIGQCAHPSPKHTTSYKVRYPTTTIEITEDI